MMHHNTQGGAHKEGLVDKAKDMMHMGHKEQTAGQPYVDPAVPYDKQDRYGNESYANQGGTIGNAYDNTPGYNPTALKEASGHKAYGTSTGIVGTETGTGAEYTTPGLTGTGYGTTGTTGYGTTGYGNTGLGTTGTTGYGSTAEYGATGTGLGGALVTGNTYAHPDKAAVLDSYGAIVTEPSHAATGAPVDPLAQPAVIGVDAAAAHGAPIIPSTYNVDHTAHTTGPVVGAIDHTALGSTGYGTTDATRTDPLVSDYNTHATTGTTAHSTTATTGSAGTETHKKGFMANIKEKVHDVTDKVMHHGKK